jgi:hypothetical protein
MLAGICPQAEPVSSFGLAGRIGGFLLALGESSPPDMDLSCLPTVPPIEPDWAKAMFGAKNCNRDNYCRKFQ